MTEHNPQDSERPYDGSGAEDPEEHIDESPIDISKEDEQTLLSKGSVVLKEVVLEKPPIADKKIILVVSGKDHKVNVDNVQVLGDNLYNIEVSVIAGY